MLPFYNIFIEKPEIKKLSNVELLHELPFYDELNVLEISKTFKRFKRNYKVETIDSKDPLAQLEANKSSVKDFFKNRLNEMKGFEYQTSVKVLLSKKKEDKGTEYCPVYFNSTTKTVINYFDKYFQEVLYRIDNWINEVSGWKIESINGDYVNICF